MLNELSAYHPRLAGYVGTNPFAHVGDATSLGLGTAMYDLMGKAAGVPVWLAMGRRVTQTPLSTFYMEHH
jgi:L-alanine-DL-glutamate epimerase-like enolase superfamily enzyme